MSTADPYRYVHSRAAKVIWALARHIHGVTRVAGLNSAWIGRGWSPDSTEHNTGRALDIIIAAVVGRVPTAVERRVGDLIAGWLIRHADALRVRHILWNKKIWRRRRASEGWQPLPGRTSSSSVSDWHIDHIHVLLDDVGGRVPDAPLIPTTTTTPKENNTMDRTLADGDVDALATAILNHNIRANGKDDALAQHLAENFVADAAQSHALGDLRDRLALVADKLDTLTKQLAALGAILEKVVEE